MAKQKTRQQLEQELDRVKSSCFWESASKVIQTAIRWGVCGLIAYFASASIHELSGLTTNAKIDIKAEASLNPEDTPVWPFWVAGLSGMIAVAGVGYGFSQRALRKLTVQHLSPYKEKWEKQFDPNRTTSGLLEDGSTHPHDE